MALNTYQEAFFYAVSIGNTDVWRRLLTDKTRDSTFPLNLDRCLLDAVKLSNPAAVEDVLKLRPHLNAEDAEGQRAIHLAAKLGPAENIRLLLQAGSMLNCVNSQGLSPLHIACQHNNLATAAALLREGASTSSARTAHHLTPLHTAVESGNYLMAELLLNNGADPNVTTSKSHGELAPLSMAILRGFTHITELLLTNGAPLLYKRDSHGNYPLHLAIESGNAEILNVLLSKLKRMTQHAKDRFGCWQDEPNTGDGHWRRASDSEKSFTEKIGEITMLDLPNCEGQSPLHMAIQKSQLKMVQMLLEAGADISATYKDMNPLELAVRCVQPLDWNSVDPLPIVCTERQKKISEGAEWDDAVVKLLCESKILLERVSPNGQYPIHVALSSGLYDVALLLCSKTPHLIDCADAAGRTALHLACKQKCVNRASRLALIDRLLEIGLSVNARTNDRGTSPLTCAIFEKDIEIVSLLLNKAPDLHSVDVDGMSPLHDAVMAQSVDVIELLIKAGADINMPDTSYRQTPLILAATNAGAEVVHCLLSHGADPNYTESRLGYSALHRTVNNFCRNPSQYLEVMHLLVMSGADLGLRDKSSLTPLQLMIMMLVCRSGEQRVVEAGFAAVKLLVEAGSELQPWRQTEEGVLRRTPMLSLTFTGLHQIAYYLANIGWPLQTETASSSGSSQQNSSIRPDWMQLPGKTEYQDALHAYLMLRLANPFSLRHLSRAAVRAALKRSRKVKCNRLEKEILTVIEKLPLPSLVRSYLSFQDRDYSCAEECWGKLLHVLPPGAEEAVSKVCQSPGGT